MHHRANDAVSKAKAKRKELKNLLPYAGRTRRAVEIEETISDLDQQTASVIALADELGLSFGMRRPERNEARFKKFTTAINALTRLAM